MYIYPKPPSSISDLEKVLTCAQIIIFLLLVTAFHFKFELSRNPLNWSRMASMDVQHPMPLELTEEAARRRRGRLHLPDRGLTLQNTSNLVEWIWTWLK